VSKDPIGIVTRSACSVLEAAGVRSSRVAVGLSGGMDSVVLLHLLTRIAPQFDLSLSAVHVHHGLSRNADAWSQFCERLCADLDVGCAVARVRIARRSKLGLEAAAREARYAVFRAQRADVIALAHHQDDQAETLLLQLLRGAGVRGLSAMPAIRALDSAGALRLLRPLLEVTRMQIHGYARKAKLAWVEDESNDDLAMDRNFLRARVLPVIAERFPAAPATLQRSARNAADASDLLDDLAQLDADGVADRGVLQANALARLSPARARNLLRWFLEREGVALPARDHLQEALRQLLHAREDARLELSLGDAVLRRHRGKIYVEAAAAAVPTGWVCAWRGEAQIALPGDLGVIRFEPTVGAGLSLERLHAQPMAVRPRSGGERMRLAHGRPTRTLKNLLQESGIPQWRRDRLPLLFCANDLVWIPEVGVDCRYAAEEGEAAVLPHWLEPTS
jgi:tRNA(Ile)-lysidine synthase